MVDTAALDQAVNDVLQLAELVMNLTLSTYACIVAIYGKSMTFAS